MNLERAIRAPSATAKARFGKLLVNIGKLLKKTSLNQVLRWGMV
jgi:hypothetical protein